MIDVLNNFRFNRVVNNQLTIYEDVNNFIPLIVPLGYKYIKSDRQTDNGIKVFIVFGSNCTQVIICFQGEYDDIEFFQRESKLNL